ncbi:MAG: HIT domain-containing protein [Candidatus Riflebacteria bacterium]|nr:HIT domain-containing protein [Candidatus Riflebacteria bacterium]
MAFKKNLFIPNKLEYVRGGKRPNVHCILCGITQNHPEVENLIIWKNDLLMVSLNLYPYNPGHLLLFPLRHIVDLREMTEEEAMQIFKVNKKFMDIIDRIYSPRGYNIGFNINDASGASIDHLHQHLVPRYHKELGFVDIISGSKIMVEDPKETLKKFETALKKHPIEV